MNISFCTTCRNRLDDLQRTLPANLAKLAADEEIVVLDYNSPDSAWSWLTTDAALERHRSQGKLRVFKESTAPRFFMSHAKNVAHLLGQGNVLVNLDADNFLDMAFLHTLRTRDWQTLGILFPKGEHGGHKGRTSIRRDVFTKLGGYDEEMNQGYGYEEIDLFYRIQQTGHTLEHVVIDAKTAIPTCEARKAEGQLVPGVSIATTNGQHHAICRAKLRRRKYWAHTDRMWGVAQLIDAAGCSVVTGRDGRLQS